MLAQVWRGVRCVGEKARLAATQTAQNLSTKSAVDGDHALFPVDADGLEAALHAPSALEASLSALSARSEQASVFSDDGFDDLHGKVSRTMELASRILPRAIRDKVNADVAQTNVIATGGVEGFALPSGGLEAGVQGNVTAAWPAPPQSPWIDMRMYQAPEAAYHQTETAPQVQNGTQAGGFLVLQPVLMPVYSPFWGMQMSMAVQQPGSMFPAVEVVSEQCGGPLVQSPTSTSSTELAAESLNADSASCLASMPEESVVSSSVRRNRRSRRGGAAKRKLAGQDGLEEGSTEASTEASSLTEDDPSISTKLLLLEAEQCVDEVADNHTKEPTMVKVERATSDDSVSTGDSSGPADSAIDPLLLELEETDETRRQYAFDWVRNSFWPLALTKRGCRIVQKAIEVGTPAYQQELLENLHGRVHEALKSPHTNYVLQKFIEIMPPERMQFVLTELEGHGLNIARHRFGCRIMQRLTEHCHPGQTERLINEVLVDAGSLCRHQYGNFVIQHILQHGTPQQRSVIADVVCQDIIRLAKHRIASHVVSCAMVHCPSEDVQRLTHAVLHDAGQVADLSRREYGSFVVREVNRAARMLRS
jgi:hypothetical protein